MKTRLYFAGPLFTCAERSWNEWLATTLRGQGFDVVLPQEEAAKHISAGLVDFAGIFKACLEGIKSVDLVVAVLDGPDADSGTAFECGYAYAIGKPVIGIRTDLRSGGEDNGVNAMLSRCCQELVHVPAFHRGDELVRSIVLALSTFKGVPAS